ncbi:UNVERIFIED_CONTAM: Phosphoinositide phospholipase C 2 [Sesamum calycinum]|uniref:Phosphoinositide phospholipase C n=1 Tax=Sesamum calycinum TaxID=2727403 RepID=A0AAW2RPS7_9LAMI
MAAAEPPADVKAIFNDYSENGTMSVDHLRQFMVEVQGEEKATIEDAQEVLDSLQHLNIFHKRGLNLEAFFKYLFGDTNPPLNPKLGEHAFVASEYPVVITLEDHLTPELQALAAEMITETFGEMLFTPGDECLSEFPSPESLKRRIMISTKPPEEYKSTGEDKDFDEDGEDAEYECGEDVAAEYRLLIAIHAGRGRGQWRAVKVDPDKVRRLSLSEQQIEKGVATHAFEIVRFTHKNLLRVYPKGTRVDSSNFDPLTAWMHGAQLVAFNMQGYGRELWMMQGMFKANGGCGYVKKPEFLLGHDGRVFDPKAAIPIRTTLRTVQRAEKIRHKNIKNKTIGDNWIPTWDEVFEFPITIPELALLRIEVHEYDMSDKDDFAGQTCLPIRELRQGIRAVPLCSQKGEKYKSVKLLMRFEFL